MSGQPSPSKSAQATPRPLPKQHVIPAASVTSLNVPSPLLWKSRSGTGE
jgi:hypothetical protein